MIYPHVLLLLFLISSAAITAADAAVTKMKTSDQLTEYYEIRVVELMAIRDVLQHPEASDFSIETNKGTTTIQITDRSETERKIRITTMREERLFYSTFFLNTAQNRIMKRTEHN
ncbi:hypothetical protein BTO30_05095 [Domibacillus antri]|uniref:Competence protein ComG n=2 Tax=Domibacillus antri TaxID=1714264 RepID=A0A1Q8Q7M4_9BACI|nr:hypothetical protein BTO30_05095 [Domibacillus antri]